MFCQALGVRRNKRLENVRKKIKLIPQIDYIGYSDSEFIPQINPYFFNTKLKSRRVLSSIGKPLVSGNFIKQVKYPTKLSLDCFEAWANSIFKLQILKVNLLLIPIKKKEFTLFYLLETDKPETITSNKKNSWSLNFLIFHNNEFWFSQILSHSMRLTFFIGVRLEAHKNKTFKQ